MLLEPCRSNSKMKCKTETKKSKIVFVLLAAVLIAQICEVYNISSLKFVGAFLIIIYSFFVDEQTTLYILMFIMPTNRLFTFWGISVNLMVIVIFFIKYFSGKNKRHSELLFSCLIFFIYTIFYFYRFSSASEMLQAIKTFMLLFFCLEIFSKKSEELLDLYKNAVMFLSIGLTSQVFVSVITNPNIQALKRLALSNDSNSNALAIICSYAIAQIVTMWNSKHINNENYLFILFVLISLIGIYTQSRIFIISFIISMAWLMLPGCKKYFSKISKGWAVVFLIAVGIYYFLFISDGVISEKMWGAINRILDPSRGDVTNGRIEIWQYYIGIFKSDITILLFGVGNEYNRVGIPIMAHNALIEQISAFGLVGSFFVFISYLKVSRLIIKKLLYNYSFSGYYNILPILIVLSSGMFSHSFMSINATLQIFLGIFTLFIVPRKDTQRKVGGNLYECL